MRKQRKEVKLFREEQTLAVWLRPSSEGTDGWKAGWTDGSCEYRKVEGITFEGAQIVFDNLVREFELCGWELIRSELETLDTI